MKQEITKKPELPPDEELSMLVDGFLDGNLSEAQRDALEKRLLSDERDQAYYADRVRFHAELQEVMQPIRVEVLQKRHLVFERKQGLPRFMARMSQVVRIGNPVSGSFLELPPDLIELSTLRRRLWIIGGALSILVLGLVALAVWQAKRAAAVDPVILALKNEGFEQVDLIDDEDALSYTILNWQDFFLSRDVSTCDLARFSQGRYTAHSGNNVAQLRPQGYLTQILRYSDGSPLLAQKGLHIRVRGWALIEGDNKREVPLRIDLRVVQEVKPEMRQYEPSHAEARLGGKGWQEFCVDLSLPTDSLVMIPSDVEPGDTIRALLDVSGKVLNLSIHNRQTLPPVIYLDDLSIEIVSEESTEKHSESESPKE